MNKKESFFWGLTVIIVFFLIFFIYYEIGLDSLASTLAILSWEFFFYSVLAMVFFSILLAYMWKVLIFKKINLKSLFDANNVAFSISYLLPLSKIVSDFTRSYYVSELNFGEMYASSVINRVIVYSVELVMTVALLFFIINKSGLNTLIWLIFIITLGIVLVYYLSLILYGNKIVHLLKKFLKKDSLILKTAGEFYNDLKYYKQRKFNIFISFCIYLLSLCVLFIANAFLLQALHIEFNFFFVLLLTIASQPLTLIPTPGSLGYEFVYPYIFLFMGYNFVSGFVYALLLRARDIPFVIYGLLHSVKKILHFLHSKLRI